jgi:CheY-like chemotaxis protein
MLAPTDYEITEVENGEEAFAAIAKQRPDLILMDVQLPIMDGYTATRRIKAAPYIAAKDGRVLQQGFTTGGMGSDRHFAWQQSSGPNVRDRDVGFVPKADIRRD